MQQEESSEASMARTMPVDIPNKKQKTSVDLWLEFCESDEGKECFRQKRKKRYLLPYDTDMASSEEVFGRWVQKTYHHPVPPRERPADSDDDQDLLEPLPPPSSPPSPIPGLSPAEITCAGHMERLGVWLKKKKMEKSVYFKNRWPSSDNDKNDHLSTESTQSAQPKDW